MKRLHHAYVERALKAKFPERAAAVDIYVREFEHMEGAHCWGDWFTSLPQVYDDFRLFAWDLGVRRV